MSQCLKVGDIIQLQSGGPRMTVSHVPDPNSSQAKMVTCTWFNPDGYPPKPYTYEFSADSLTLLTLRPPLS
jgi:uncharacterized protein YodC (DUF2158 family)